MRLMGLEDPQVAEAAAVGENATFFVGYGKLTRPVELSKLRVAKPMWEELDQGTINRLVHETLGRPMVVVGGGNWARCSYTGARRHIELQGVCRQPRFGGVFRLQGDKHGEPGAK